MEQLEIVIKDLVREAVKEYLDPPAPELMTIEEAALVVECDRSTIDALVHDAPANGFPVTKLSKRTIKIIRPKFYDWLNAGGLNGINQETR